MSLVNYFDSHSGSGRAVSRLHAALLRAGQESRLLVCRQDSQATATCDIAAGWRRPWLGLTQRLAAAAARLQRSRNPMPHSLNCFSAFMCDKILASAPDVVHLHWVNGEMLTIAEIAWLARRRPLLWTFHDAWPLCGAEHHCLVGGNERWRHGYDVGNREDPGVDVDRWVWRRKRRHWTGLGLNVIAPSRWLASMAAASPLFQGGEIRVIPNGLDLSVFHPHGRAQARAKLGLPPDKPLVGFGAAALGNLNKGGGELREILSRLKETHGDIELVTVGAGGLAAEVPFPSHALGNLAAEADLADFYSALDVFVLPSRQDNLPNMIMEAMACGAPCVAYDIGGMADLIDHGGNGYLAKPFDGEDFSAGVAAMLAVVVQMERAEQARRKVVECFAIEKICKAHLDFYAETVDRHGRGKA